MTAQAYALSQAQFLSLLHSVSCANTAAATTSGIDLTGYEGLVTLVIDVGAIAGTLALRVEDSADNSTFGDPANAANFNLQDNGVAGTYSKDMAAVAGHLYGITIDQRAVKRYIRFLGTIATGPSLLSVLLVIGAKKYRP
jgi:hypothetical protein